MISKDIDHIAEEDLQRLITNAVTEKKTLEYKQALTGNTDSDKKEFLAFGFLILFYLHLNNLVSLMEKENFEQKRCYRLI